MLRRFRCVQICLRHILMYTKRDPVLIQFYLIEIRCVITVSTPAVWLARENIKKLTPRPCIDREYAHGVNYMENTT